MKVERSGTEFGVVDVTCERNPVPREASPLPTRYISAVLSQQHDFPPAIYFYREEDVCTSPMKKCHTMEYCSQYLLDNLVHIGAAIDIG